MNIMQIINISEWIFFQIRRKWMILTTLLREESPSGDHRQDQRYFHHHWRPILHFTHPTIKDHASRGGGGSMGGHASAGPQSEPRLSDKYDNQQFEHCQRSIVPSTAAASSNFAESFDEESGEHNEAIEPHKAWLDDQYCCQQTCRWGKILKKKNLFFLQIFDFLYFFAKINF